MIDPSLTRWYHWVTRCVRRAYLLGDKEHNRKEWIESRLEELAGCFAVAVGGFAVMNNHLHVLLRLDPDIAAGWSDDEEARLATCVYIDLNPIAAKIAVTPEASDHTSIKQRLEHVEAQGQTAQLEAASDGSVAGSLAAAGLEESLWLCPIDDRRGLGSSREGMMADFPLGTYVRLVGYTGRLFRRGMATISAELAGIFDRLGSNARSWQVRMKKLREGWLLGRFFAASHGKLQEIAEHLNVRYVVNLARCPAR